MSSAICSTVASRCSRTAVLGRDRFRRLSSARFEQARVNFIPAEITGSGSAPLDAHRVREVGTPALPHAERVEIPQASHIMHEDNAPAWRSALLAFLGRADHRPDAVAKPHGSR
jgi:pimeloyl-ACP methyl ester carboxylesterase